MPVSFPVLPAVCIETSGSTFHLALAEGASSSGASEPHWLFSHSEHLDSQRSHSALLIPLLSEALQKNTLALKDVNSLVVGLGPGSFTGLRASVCTVRALAQAQPHLKVYGINRFELLAEALRLHTPKVTGLWCLALDARRGFVYTSSARFEQGGLLELSAPSWVSAQETLNPSSNLSAPAWNGYVLEESLIALLPNSQGCGCSEPVIKTSALEALVPKALLKAATHKAPTPYQALEPLYLQQPNITLKK